jgi:hypothetical protein
MRPARRAAINPKFRNLPEGCAIHGFDPESF